MAEREGFEPSIPLWGIHTFQACSFDHSDTSPCIFCLVERIEMAGKLQKIAKRKR